VFDAIVRAGQSGQIEPVAGLPQRSQSEHKRNLEERTWKS